jgi:hypothetical protein
MFSPIFCSVRISLWSGGAKSPGLSPFTLYCSNSTARIILSAMLGLMDRVVWCCSSASIMVHQCISEVARPRWQTAIMVMFYISNAHCSGLSFGTKKVRVEFLVYCLLHGTSFWLLEALGLSQQPWLPMRSRSPEILWECLK